MTPVPTPIYHITHVDNLESILTTGGLLAYNAMNVGALDYINIAYTSIQSRRARTPVPVAAGGVLHDYVPFYFAPRSPMLYTISRGNVEGYTEGQQPVIHLVSTAQIVQSAKLPFAFTDGHAIVAISEFFDDLSQLNRIDWNIMRSRYWFDTIEDGDRKRRRQAEFLVYNSFSWHLITEIGVINTTIHARVQQVLQKFTISGQVRVRPNWYY